MPLGASSLGAFPAGDILGVLQGRGVPTALVLGFHPSLLPWAQMSWLVRWLQKASRRVGRSVCEVLLARPGIWKGPPRGLRAVGVKPWPTGPGEQALRGWLGLCAVLGLDPVAAVFWLPSPLLSRVLPYVDSMEGLALDGPSLTCHPALLESCSCVLCLCRAGLDVPMLRALVWPSS